MIKEIAVERYRFECGWCGARFTRDYDVQYVLDPDGGMWSFYWLDGLPALFADPPEGYLKAIVRP